MREVEKAVLFIRAKGNSLEQSRLKILLQEPMDMKEALRPITETQGSDGGWKPFWAESSALDSTCFRLAQLEQMDVLGSEETVKHALRFITSRQKDNGSWEEDDTLADFAPPWCMPGDLSAQLYLTANCAYWVALFYESPDRVHSAGHFLASHVGSEGKMPSFLHTHWLSAGVLFSAGNEPDAERTLSYLGSRLDDLDASNLAWMISSLRGMGISDQHPLIEQSMVQLLTKQEPDGRFPSDDGSDQDVHVTLEAIRALQRG